jgi:hypothetical protein
MPKNKNPLQLSVAQAGSNKVIVTIARPKADSIAILRLLDFLVASHGADRKKLAVTLDEETERNATHAVTIEVSTSEKPTEFARIALAYIMDF